MNRKPPERTCNDRHGTGNNRDVTGNYRDGTLANRGPYRLRQSKCNAPVVAGGSPMNAGRAPV
ncbi:hypothetical protein DPMN_113937 [Dreissena polymorpha]|uniref:Uncharacterized protein n=1 Tax=Dreissena polymorpha TaxID=45954 RepID=A0A9D4KID7_DREPO|nr:hypothetical protein DPMN_113937 [Dreissena polymorpha]